MFWKRLFSGVILLAIAIITMAVGGPLLAGVLYIVSLIAFRELTAATKCSGGEKSFSWLERIGVAGVSAYYVACYFAAGMEKGGIILFAVIMGIFLVELFAYVVAFPKFKTEQISMVFFAFLYAPVMLAFTYLARALQGGQYIVWLILISAWGCDTCAYVVGMLIGKKKIFPHLSPKKSLEGCFGGVLGAMLIGALYARFFVAVRFQEKPVVLVITIICGVGAVMSMIGDLVASAIKRDHDIKDYGKLIPGHGGIMDRFDSIIITAPLVYFLAYFMLEQRLI